MGRRRTTYEDFLRRAREAHGDRYTYPPKEDFEGVKFFLRIICAKHGGFMQRASHHIYGNGCPKCGRDKALETAQSNRKPARREDRHDTLGPFGALGGLYQLPFWNKQ